MTNLLRTTITLPEDLLEMAKLICIKEKKTLSELVRESIKEKVRREKPLYSKKELFSLMGSIKSDSPMFKNPEKYVKELREESDEHGNFFGNKSRNCL